MTSINETMMQVKLAGIEAVVLTGGASRRFGTDKASFRVGGETIAGRIVSQLHRLGLKVTVLGRSPIPGASFFPDTEEYRGPLAAISQFDPTHEHVFIAAGDMPFFDGDLVSTFADLIGTAEAVVPVIDDRIQPLCGLYRSATFERTGPLVMEGCLRLMTWVEGLSLVRVENDMLLGYGFDVRTVIGVNSIDELNALQKEGEK